MFFIHSYLEYISHVINERLAAPTGQCAARINGLHGLMSQKAIVMNCAPDAAVKELGCMHGRGRLAGAGDTTKPGTV